MIWVKENKIIANAPPDFEYFQEKSRDLYGLRIADTFLEDSGLYICEAYGAGGSEITCWCKLQVLGNKKADQLETHINISRILCKNIWELEREKKRFRGHIFFVSRNKATPSPRRR